MCMSKNPFINAASAFAYIILVVSVMTFVTQPLRDKPDTFFAPVMALSILTLSVAVMAYIFFYQPIILFIENKRKEAVELFTKTVGIFSIFTILALALLTAGVI